jgi:hypothetical protein
MGTIEERAAIGDIAGCSQALDGISAEIPQTRTARKAIAFMSVSSSTVQSRPADAVVAAILQDPKTHVPPAPTPISDLVIGGHVVDIEDPLNLDDADIIVGGGPVCSTPQRPYDGWGGLAADLTMVSNIPGLGYADLSMLSNIPDFDEADMSMMSNYPAPDCAGAVPRTRRVQPDLYLGTLKRLVKKGIRQAHALVSVRNELPTPQEQYSTFQYILLHWTVLLGYPPESILNFTVLDFVNHQNNTFKIRKYMTDENRGFYVVIVPEIMHNILKYYFTVIRPLWLPKQSTATHVVTIPFHGCTGIPPYTECSSFFFINTLGNPIINVSQILAQYQTKQLRSRSKEDITISAIATVRAIREIYPEIDRQMSQMAQDPHALCDEATLAELCPLGTIHSGTDIPTKSALTKMLVEKAVLTLAEARAAALTYWGHIAYQRSVCRAADYLQRYHPTTKPKDEHVIMLYS